MKALTEINDQADNLDLDQLSTDAMPPVLEMAATLIAVWPTIKAILNFAKLFTGKRADTAIEWFIWRMEGTGK